MHFHIHTYCSLKEAISKVNQIWVLSAEEKVFSLIKSPWIRLIKIIVKISKTKEQILCYTQKIASTYDPDLISKLYISLL